MKSILFLFCVIASLWISGCETDAKIALPDVPVKLVVTSFIAPQDTVLRVKVTKSIPIFETSFNGANDVIDAHVVLSDGTTSATLTYNGYANRDYRAGYYVIPASQLPIKPGQTYLLTVSVPDGQQVTASCTVPARKCEEVTTHIDTITVTQYPGQRIKTYQLRVEWQDIVGEGNYYRPYAEVMNGYYTNLLPDGSRNVIDTSYRGINFEKGEFYFKDAEQDGRRFMVQDGKFTSADMLIYPTDDTFYVERKLNVFLLTTDENYYRYHRSLENYTEDNPFAEPTLVYSNIQGGLGVFAAYQRFTKRVYY